MILFILLILFRFNVICLKEKKSKEKKEISQLLQLFTVLVILLQMQSTIEVNIAKNIRHFSNVKREFRL